MNDTLLLELMTELISARVKQINAKHAMESATNAYLDSCVDVEEAVDNVKKWSEGK